MGKRTYMTAKKGVTQIITLKKGNRYCKFVGGKNSSNKSLKQILRECGIE